MHPCLHRFALPLAISHAGDTDHGDPACSAAAYRRARDLGYRWFQVDAVAIGGGVLVAQHAVAGRRRSWEHLDVATVSARAGRPVATLEALLAQFPDACWNIEVKARVTIPGLVDLLRRPGVLERVCVSSPFHRSIGRALRAEFGDRVCLCAPLVDGGLLGLPLWPFGRVRHDVVQVWWPLVWSRRVIARVRSRGLMFQVWTVNPTRRAHRLLRWGATGLITDRHEALRDGYRTLGCWPD